MHTDGTVLIEGTQGITIDSASAKLELKGGQISHHGHPGRHRRRRRRSGQGAPSGSQLDLKGGAMASLSAALVKIN